MSEYQGLLDDQLGYYKNTYGPFKGAYIGGSGTWGVRFPEDLNLDGVRVWEVLQDIQTPWGVARPVKIWSVDGHTLLRFSFHGHRRGILHPFVTSLQVGYIMDKFEIPWAVIDASVGGIQNLCGGVLHPGTAVVPHDVDIHNPDNVTMVNGKFTSFLQELIKISMKKNNNVPGAFRLREPLHPRLRSAIIAGARQHFDEVMDRGVYVQPPISSGSGTLTFESPAEIERYRRTGGHVVGQTLGYEVLVNAAYRIPIAHLSIPVNYAEGRNDTWTREATMPEFYAECGHQVGRAMVSAIRYLLEDPLVHTVKFDYAPETDPQLGRMEFPVE